MTTLSRSLAAAALAAACALPLAAQTKHPFTFDDMMALERIGEPAPSPDGRWILFSAVDVDVQANTRTSHVWVVPRAGGEPREILGGQDASRPRWAPDGRRFLFMSSKQNGSQVWVADFDGRTGAVAGVKPLTTIATEADGALWSPDGRTVLFVSSVYPDCADEACDAKKLEENEKSKVKAQIFTRLLYRHWNAYGDGRRSHLFATAIDDAHPRDLTPGDFDAPVFSLGGQDNYAFSPDGQEICYTSNHDSVEATSTNNDLWIVPVAGGAAKKITDNPASDSSPLYSPDGRYIAYRAQVRPGYESDRFRLMLYDRKAGGKRNLTEDFDRWVGTFTWAPDSSALYFSAENKGEAPIFVVDVAGGPVRQVETGYNDDLAFAGADTLVFTRMSLQQPIEIYALDGVPALAKAARPWPATSDQAPKATALTRLNQGVLARDAMAPLETFWFTGAENARVQGFIVRPPDFDPSRRYPVKFLIHGGPQGAWGDDWSFRWNSELFAANGYVIVMVNPRGSTGYGQQFIDDINGDWGGRVMEDLMKGLDYAEQHYPFIDKDRECALGASYGGYAINWLLGHSSRFKCFVSHDGMFNAESAWGTTEELWFNEWEFKGTPYTNRELYRKWSPHLAATDFKTPTLVVHGQRDYRLDVSEGFQLFTTLQRMGVPSEMLYFPDEGHWVLKPQNGRLWYQTVNAWVDRWAKPSR